MGYDKQTQSFSQLIFNTYRSMAIKVIHCENTTVLLTTIDSSRKKHRKILRQLLLLNSTVVVFMQKLFIAIGL